MIAAGFFFGFRPFSNGGGDDSGDESGDGDDDFEAAGGDDLIFLASEEVFLVAAADNGMTFLAGAAFSGAGVESVILVFLGGGDPLRIAVSGIRVFLVGGDGPCDDDGVLIVVPEGDTFLRAFLAGGGDVDSLASKTFLDGTALLEDCRDGGGGVEETWARTFSISMSRPRFWPREG